MIFSNQKFGIQNNLFHFSIARFVHPVIRLAGNSNSEVVGADTNMRGVDVSAEGGNNGVVNSLQERSLDSSLDIVNQGSLDGRVVDQGSLDGRVVDDGLENSSGDQGRDQGRVVDSGSVDQGGVSLSLGLTLGDVRYNGGDLRHNGVGGEGLEAGEDLAQDGSGESGVVDMGNLVGQGSLDGRIVDQGSLNGRVVYQRSLDGRVVDQRFVEGEGVCVNNRSRHLLSLLSHREGLVNHGSLDRRVVDDGLVNTSGDQGRDQGRVVDSGSEGQSVGGVDQSRVSLRLSFSLPLAVGAVAKCAIVVGVVVVSVVVGCVSRIVVEVL